MPTRPTKYNPSFLTSDELIQAFVVRHTDLDLIVELLRENTGPSNQHILVIGPRGIGKTTLVLRAAAEVKTVEELDRRWYPLVFAEESYQVGTAGEFWLEALWHLARQTSDLRWERTHEELNQEQDDNRLRERALAQLMDFSDQIGRRILLIVENLNMLIEDMHSEQDAWALRHTLQNEPRLMLLATATSRFDEIENQGQAMFELFKPHTLHPLNTEECRAVWSAVSGSEVREECIRPIEILTGGSPRLLTIVSSFGKDLSLKELMGDLLTLVDDHTEYFKIHLDSLPARERKAYVALLEIWEPASARQVAESARLDVNKTSALLARLVTRGAVVVEKISARKKQYRVAERMFNIYYLLRRRGGPTQRVRALVDFMLAFYTKMELVNVSCKIADEAKELDPESRADHLLVLQGILARIPDDAFRAELLDALPRELLVLLDAPQALREQIESAKPDETPEPGSPVAGLLRRADKLQEENRLEEAELIFRKVVDLDPENVNAWVKYAILPFTCSGDSHLYVNVYQKLAELDCKVPAAWAILGLTLSDQLECYEEAVEALQRAIRLNAGLVAAWIGLGYLLHDKMNNLHDAEKLYRQAIDELPKWANLFRNRLMRLLLEVRRSEEALDYLQDYLAAHSSIEKDKSDAISLVEEFTASGHAEEALQVLRHSPSAMFLEPLKVALQIDVGEDVAAAVEVREVANDIVQRIKKRRAELQDTKPDLRRILLLHKQWLDSDGGEGKRADLTDADLRRVHLCRANLRGAKLCGSNLRKANLRNADLRNADLRNADLKEADLRGANLTATDLTNADLQGIDLRGANLKHAKLKTHQLEKIITDGTTILPIPSKSPRKYAPQY